ncbi:MAG: hypothetical protein ACOCP8_09785 [archaeon]
MKKIKEINGLVLQKSDLSNFNFNNTAYNEIKTYCIKKLGYKVDRIIIESIFKADANKSEDIKSNSKSKLIIYKKNNEIIVFLKNKTNIKYD